MSRSTTRSLLTTFTAEEQAVIRQAAARMIRYDRYHRRRLCREPGRRASSRGFEGKTADQALNAYAHDIELWHDLADAACALVQDVTGKAQRRPRSY